MASIPHFHSNYSCPNDFSQFPNPLLFSQENCIGGVAAAGAIPATTTATSWGDDEVSFPMLLDNIGGLDVFQQESVQAALFPDLIGISFSDLSSVVPTALPADNNVAAGLCGIQNLGVSRYQYQDVCEFGDECTGFVHQDFNQANDPTHVTDNWVYIFKLPALHGFVQFPEINVFLGT